MLPSARQDLINLGEYLLRFYKSTALKRFDKIEKRISLLEEQPMMYEEYFCASSDLHFRKMVIDEFLVFYVVLDDTVEIHAIVNGKTDYAKHFLN